MKNFLKSFSKELPKGFRLLNYAILIPIIIWPLIFYSTIFFFDNPKSMAHSYLLFFVVNSYPVYLFILLELNSRLYLKWKSLGFFLPGLMILLCCAVVLNQYKEREEFRKRLSEKREQRVQEGYLGSCDTYKVSNDSTFYKGIDLGADPQTLYYLGCHYARDKNNVFHGADVIEEADPSTFEIIDWQWQKDKNYYFNKGSIMRIIQYESFEILPANYSKDSKNVYYYDQVVIGADPETFEVDILTHLGKDKHRTYKNGKSSY